MPGIAEGIKDWSNS